MRPIDRAPLRVSYIIESLVGGGAETSLAALAPHYAERGIELEVVYLKDVEGLQGQLEAAGSRLICAAGPGGRAGNVRRVAAHLRDRKPDLVHTTLFEADVAGRIAARLTRVPVVSSVVNVQYGPEHYAAPHIKRQRLKAAQILDIVSARTVARIHALTGHVADIMSDRLSIPRERIDVVPRGRDATKLGVRSAERALRTRSALGVSEQAPLVVAAARQEFQKGLDILLKAWPEVTKTAPNAVLAIAGREGNHTSELRALGDGLDGSIRWLRVRDDVPDLLAAADTFVLPSRWEGLGSVLIEAMALETPIVSSDLAPVREVVADCATLVPPADPGALATALNGVLTNPAGSAALARRGRMRFEEHFTIESVADQMKGFYETALGYKDTVVAEPRA
jgi:glycosyltransferase involved in cell wall biosynthesis